ncbi:hypothetical protein GCM10009555_038260 [Acrocarpospora macrocephala]|uniref:Uncharacterized protein n=1 Tax=Acrocarpospora macrocephala TaxID=150177 RepID=A0A5M3WNR4_9ACTN|nr:hypothetical protein Amac_033080 [Acrocarpospora macrocephala]
MTGRDAEADALSEFGDGKAPVLLELGKDSPVYIVHGVDSPPQTRFSRKDWKHISDIRA